MKTEIVIKNLSKSYGKKQALRGVNLQIEKGVFGLLGRNGAGKTTLMKVLATLLEKDSGKVKICGIPLEHASEIRKITGYLPQEFSMYPNMSVYEAMDYLGVLSGLDKLRENSRTKVRALSGGMKRRLGIAQAILHDPKVLIVDEPTAGLDPEERVRFRNLLSEIAEDRIVILSTHIVGDVEAACEKIAVMDEGKIIYRGTVEELVNLVEGRVYRAEISRKELERLKSEYTVTSMITLGNNVMVRFLSETTPFQGAQHCDAGVKAKYMNITSVYLIRVGLSLLESALLVLVYIGVMHSGNCEMEVGRYFFGTMAEILAFGGLGIFAYAVSDNLIVGYMIPLGYYIAATGAGYKYLGKLYPFGMLQDFTTKYWIFAIGILLMAVGLLLFRRKR